MPVEEFTFTDEPTAPAVPVTPMPAPQPAAAPMAPAAPAFQPTLPALTPPVLLDDSAPDVDEPDSTPRRRRGGQPVLGSEKLARRHLQRRILVGGVCVLVGLMAVNTAANIVNRPPSPEDVAATVASQVPGDGSLAPLTATAEQFVRAYLTVTPGAEEQRRTLLNALTDGQGASWVSTQDASAQQVVSGPVLALPPAPSTTYPEAFNLVYKAWVQGEDGIPRVIVLSVPTALADNAQGVVVAAPSWLPNLDADAPALPQGENNGTVVEAARPNVEQFLKAWAIAGPNSTDEARTTLEAFLTPDATMYTTRGLDGAVTYGGLLDLRLAPVAEGSTDVAGTVTVIWKTPTAGQFRQTYALQLRQQAGKWLVQRIGVL